MSRYDKFNERERRPKPQKSIDTKKEFNKHLIKEYRSLDVFPIDRYKNREEENIWAPQLRVLQAAVDAERVADAALVFSGPESDPTEQDLL